MAKTLARSPAPDQLYRVRKGDSLLEVAGETYSVGAGGERMGRAQLVNRHPFNWRYHVAVTSSFNKRFFPEGMLTFMPRFSCTDADFNDPLRFAPAGKCFAIAFLPPASDIWLRPPPEIVQPDPLTCWAAAFLSWSMAAHPDPYLSMDDVLDTFRAVTVEIPGPKGTVTRSLVNPSDALVRWPKEEVVFKRNDGTRIRVPAGRLTLEAVATELEVSVEVRDHTLTLRDVMAILARSAGPVIVLKTSPGEVGHAVVIFGASEQDEFLGEMNPLPVLGRPTGPAMGPLGTRWLPTFDAFAEHQSHIGVVEPWAEFVFLFKAK